MIRAVLFDAVGTLIELREPVGETYSRALADHGVKVSSRRIGQAFGRVVAKAEPLVFPGAEPALLPALERDWWRRVVRDTLRASASACPVADLDACFEDLWRHYASPAAWRLREGAAEILIVEDNPDMRRLLGFFTGHPFGQSRFFGVAYTPVFEFTGFHPEQTGIFIAFD